jgi:VWFA-related protein
LALCSFQVAAQDSGPFGLRLLKLDQEPNGAVRVLVSVTDARGRPVQGLGASHFALSLQGEQIQGARIEKASQPDQPLSVVLAIDSSDVTNGTAIAAAKAAAAAFVDRLASDDSCAVMVFSDGVRWPESYTRDKAALRRAIESIPPGSAKARLYQALLEGADRAAIAPTARSVVVLLSGGKDAGGGISAEDAFSRVAASGVPVYALAFGSGADEEGLRRVAVLSRGAFYAAADAEELRRVYDQIAEQLNSDYLLSFSVPGPASGARTLTVILRHRGQIVSAQAKLSFDRGRWTGILRAYSHWLIVAAIGLLIATMLMVIRSRRRPKDEDHGTIVIRRRDSPRVWLEVTRGPSAGERLELRGREALVGRDGAKVQLCIKEDLLVSGKHLRLTANSRGQWVAEDLDSGNGTHVNGTKLKEPMVLRPNDRIQIGLSELLYVDVR